MARWLPRRRLLNRFQVDNAGWRHPRPPADPRLVFLVVGLAWVSFAQTFIVRPETAVATKAFTEPAAIAVALLVVVSSSLHLYAAFCESQWRSWVIEAGATFGFFGQAMIQLLALRSVNTEWWATSTLAWTLFWGAGNLVRCAILVRRLW